MGGKLTVQHQACDNDGGSNGTNRQQLVFKGVPKHCIGYASAQLRLAGGKVRAVWTKLSSNSKLVLSEL